jgi:hypothetical protein
MVHHQILSKHGRRSLENGLLGHETASALLFLDVSSIRTFIHSDIPQGWRGEGIQVGNGGHEIPVRGGSQTPRGRGGGEARGHSGRSTGARDGGGGGGGSEARAAAVQCHAGPAAGAPRQPAPAATHPAGVPRHPQTHAESQ